MDPLEHEPFSWCFTKSATLRIAFNGDVVTVVAGREAVRLHARLLTADPPEVQQLLARATGNFKRGNEPRSRRS